MSESSNTNLEQAKQEGKYIRTIRSFVKREGRLTKGQAAAIEKCWPTMGLEHKNGMLDLSEVFGLTKTMCLKMVAYYP